MKKKRGWPKGKKRGPRKEKLLTLDEVLKEKVKDPEFKKAYEEENKKLAKEYSEIASQSFEGIVEEVRVEEIPVEKAKGNVRYRGDKVRETILTEGWQRYIKQRIVDRINEYKDDYDNVSTVTELEVNKVVRKELQAILNDIDDWLVSSLELAREE